MNDKWMMNDCIYR